MGGAFYIIITGVAQWNLLQRSHSDTAYSVLLGRAGVDGRGAVFSKELRVRIDVVAPAVLRE